MRAISILALSGTNRKRADQCIALKGVTAIYDLSRLLGHCGRWYASPYSSAVQLLAAVVGIKGVPIQFKLVLATDFAKLNPDNKGKGWL